MHTRFRRLAIVLAWLGAVDTAGSAAQDRAPPAPAPGQTALHPGPFNAIAVRNGAHVVVRPGPAQRANLVRGSLEHSRVAITDGGELVIDRCIRSCPRGYRLEVEIATPSISRISLADGGTIETRGDFPRQGALTVAVSSGGTIDVRSIVAGRVTASVDQGGRILTVPQSWLLATVNQGGIITYWGDARVRSSVHHGGVVTRGDAADAYLRL